MARANTVYTAALVGCGRIGYTLGLDRRREQPASHTMAFNANPRISLVAGCDRDFSNLQAWHEANRKASIYHDSADLYARLRTDIITVAVNEEAHKREALAAINAGPKLVILEKPVALNSAEALLIQGAAENHGVPVLVNHERRFAADYIAAKEWMAQIGGLQSVSASLYSGMAVYDPAEEASGAYSLIHDGTHLVDAVLFFLEKDGEPSGTEYRDMPAVQASPVRDSAAPGTRRSGLLGAALRFKEPAFSPPPVPQEKRLVSTLLHDPVLSAVLRDEKGCVRQLSAHYSLPSCPDVTINFSGRSRYFGFEITITGTEGRICIGNGCFKCYRSGASPLYSGFSSLLRDKNVRPPRKTLFLSNMVQNAVDFLDGTASLRSTLQNGINALVILEEIKAALLRTSA